MVLLVSALLGLWAWRVGKSAERMERDPKYYRRSMYVFAAFFLLPAIIEIVDVASGTDSKSHLLGVPFSLGIAWFFFNLGKRAKVSPQPASPPNPLK